MVAGEMAFVGEAGPRAEEAAGPAVAVGLLDGSTKNGRVAKFDPGQPDLLLETGARIAGLRPTVTSIACEGIAYIGFLKGPGLPQPPRGAAAEQVRIHVPAGKSFLVIPAEGGAGGRLGFFAHPAEPQSELGLLFFYNGGINARESPEPLGALLVKQGAVTPEDLQRGLKAQEEARRIPIGQILIEQNKVTPDAMQRAAELQQRRRMRIGEILVQEGLATFQDVDAALAEQKKRKGRKLGELLVDMGTISEEVLAKCLASKFHIPFVNLDQCEMDPAVIRELPIDLMEKYRVLLLQIDAKRATVVLADPLAVDVLDALRFALRRQIDEVLAVRSQLDGYVSRFLGQMKKATSEMKMTSILRELSVEDVVQPSRDAQEETSVSETDNAVIRLAYQIIVDAYRRGASDIHLEPNGRESPTSVRFRVDGDCEDYQEIPSGYRLPLVARFKILAGLDIAERRKPQDGKIRLKLPEQTIELRVATIPTVNGNEDVVLRILAASKPLPLEKMSLSPSNLDRLREAANRPYGLVLCVGPTGSGKTTTLHSVLGFLNTKDRKIWTAEDPVEITQARLRQVQVNAKIGFTFATAMRAFLRADPDVIMIGEMRDQETASIAVEASLTGHLVLSTLHTNSAPETITRLVDMGLDPFSFSDALLAVVAQRLARSLCSRCREAYRPPASEFESLAERCGPAFLAEAGISATDFMLWRGRGCDDCRGSGYRGRIGIHELLVADDKLKAAIQHKATAEELRKLAQEGGMRTLFQDGADKCIQGLTDLNQILAVCSR